MSTIDHVDSQPVCSIRKTVWSETPGKYWRYTRGGALLRSRSIMLHFALVNTHYESFNWAPQIRELRERTFR